MAEKDKTSDPQSGNTDPMAILLDRRIDHGVEKALAARDFGSGGGGGHIETMNVEPRLRQVEGDVATIKGSLDWAKIVAGILASVTVGGFAIVITLLLFTMSKVDGIAGKIADEFRSQRTDQVGQVQAISAAITAAKQQPPQVLLVPAPSPQIAPEPQKKAP